MQKIRIGSGAGYAGDRIEPAVDLIKLGNLDYIIFECLAERTIALAHREKKANKHKGYNNLLEYRMEKIIPLLKENPVKIITNMGAANPLEAAMITKNICQKHELNHLKIAYVYGDDVLDILPNYQKELTLETANALKSFDKSIISANAYIGAESIVSALENGADIVITGRASDPSLTVGPLVYEFNKSFEAYDFLAKATVAGHLLECGAQVTGGYYANPPLKEVPELWNIGFPIIEFLEDGQFTVEKLPGRGGLLSTETVKEQLIYEIHNPEEYLTPDVVVDFSQINVEEKNAKILVTEITGRPTNGKLKTSIGYDGGFIAEGEISYGGSNAYKLSLLAAEILNHRIELIGINFEDEREDYIGMNSLYGKNLNSKSNMYKEIRLRKAIRVNEKQEAIEFCREFESLYTNGPAGGGGIRTRITEVVAIESILIPKKVVPTAFKIL